MIEELPLSSIHINRDERQRRTLSGIEELADSIARRGLLHPIVIDEYNTLIAGERRYRAHEFLQLPTILCRRFSELSDHDRIAIELEENIKRQDISWDERVLATQRYHELRLSETPEWTSGDTARELGMSPGHISQYILVAKELSSGNKLIADAPKLSTAIGIAARLRERRESAALEVIQQTTGNRNDQRSPIHCADFIEWASKYNGHRFSFIHCDFPYGIGAGNFDQSAARSFGGYDDSEGTYWALCNCLARELNRLAAPQCHLIFWFSPKFYERTRLYLIESGWTVNPWPLIWTKVNAGPVPFPDYGPRNTYEMAFFAYRGDAKIIRPVANHCAMPIVTESHMTEKPQAMLEHFFRMFVDNDTSMLDPTCGSGSSLRAAKACGASYLTGLEKNPTFAEDAIRRYNACLLTG